MNESFLNDIQNLPTADLQQILETCQEELGIRSLAEAKMAWADVVQALSHYVEIGGSILIKLENDGGISSMSLDCIEEVEEATELLGVIRDIY